MIILVPVPGSQIVYRGRIKTSKAKIRRARLVKGNGAAQQMGERAC